MRVFSGASRHAGGEVTAHLSEHTIASRREGSSYRTRNRWPFEKKIQLPPRKRYIDGSLGGMAPNTGRRRIKFPFCRELHHRRSGCASAFGSDKLCCE